MAPRTPNSRKVDTDNNTNRSVPESDGSVVDDNNDDNKGMRTRRHNNGDDDDDDGGGGGGGGSDGNDLGDDNVDDEVIDDSRCVGNDNDDDGGGGDNCGSGTDGVVPSNGLVAAAECLGKGTTDNRDADDDVADDIINDRKEERHNIDDGGGDDDNDDDDDVNDDDDDDDYEDDPAIPIDKGRAWLVMISCFLMHVLVVGGGKSFGVFVPEFQDRFQVGAKELGIINGMALLLMLGLGIFVNMLAVRFSARRVVTAGGVLTTTGFVLTAFTSTFNWLYVTYGLITGLGLALSFSPTIVMIGQCFQKYRALAVGFALSGAGFGAFAFPGLARLLINQYGLRGCLLIIGALMSHVTVCGFLLPPHRSKSRNSNSSFKKNGTRRRRYRYNSVGGDGGNEEDGEFPLVGSDAEQKECSKIHSVHCEDEDDIKCSSSKFRQKLDSGSSQRDEMNNGVVDCDGRKTTTTTVSSPTHPYAVIEDYFSGENVKIEVIEDVSLQYEMEVHPSQHSELEKLNNGPDKLHLMSLSNDHNIINPSGQRENNKSCENPNRPRYDHMVINDAEHHNVSKSTNFLHVHNHCNITESNTSVDSLSIQHPRGKDRKSISTSHIAELFKQQEGRHRLLTVQNMTTSKSSLNSRISTSLAYISNCNLAMASQQGNLDRHPSIVTSRSHQEPNGPHDTRQYGTRRTSNKNKVKVPLFEWSLLRDPPFIMHFFSAYLGYTCYITNLFMLPDYASTCGIDQDTAAFTLSVVGILELIARLTFPLVSEFLCCRRRVTWGTSLAVMGVLNIAVPYMDNLSTIMAYAVLFGYSCGCFTCLIPVLCAEIKGPDKMGSCFGLTTMAMGLAVMTGPPLCGYIKDQAGHWRHGFVLAGVLSLVSASLAFLYGPAKKRWGIDS